MEVSIYVDLGRRTKKKRPFTCRFRSVAGQKNRDRLNSEKERFDFGSESKTKSWNKSMEATSRGLVGLLVPAKGEQIHARDGGASAVVAAAAS